MSHFLSVILSSVPAFAIFCVPQRSQFVDQRKVAERGQTDNVAVIDTPDRKSADGFGADNKITARAVAQRYSASGDVRCPGGSGGQGQITITNDIIVTSSHIFDATLDCKSRIAFKDCRFVATIDGVEKEYKFKSVEGTGHICPRPKGSKKSESLAHEDWLVLKLEQKTDLRIKPYKIPIYGRNNLAPGQKVVAVAKSSDWPEPGKQSIKDFPKHYADCETKRIGMINLSKVVETNCDMSAGSSGGAMLTPGDDPVLLGIVRGEIDPLVLENCVSSRAKVAAGQGSYAQGCWAGGMVKIEDDFKKTIMKATGLTDDGREQGPRDEISPGLKLPPLPKMKL